MTHDKQTLEQVVAEAVYEYIGDNDATEEEHRRVLVKIAKAAIAAYEKAMWRPIEEFSKHDDSGVILLKDNRHVVAGYFRHEELSGFFYHDYPDDYNLYAIEPTHWMPLPTPPTEEK